VIDFYTSSEPSEPKVGVQILNGGPGVAILQKITYFVDQKPVKEYEDAARASKTDETLVENFDFDEGDDLAVNEAHWIIFRDNTNKKELEKFSDFVDQRLGVEVRYCSIAGECWTKCSVKGMCGK
jgi:hypothetical protein